MNCNIKKIAQKFIAIALCIIILLCNSIWMFKFDIPSNQISCFQISSERQQPVEVASVSEEKDERNINITSRGGTRSKKIEYTIYEFNINHEKKLYFDNIEKAEFQKDYLLRNTEGVSVKIKEIIQENKDNLSSEFNINNTIENYILKYKKKTRCFPTISRTVTSTYGKRASRGDFHTGIDLAGKYGDNIYAFKSGTVIKVQHSNVSYGNMVLIKHSDGSKTRYAHMSSIIVKSGQYVGCGDTIGYMGSTGNSTGVHLHFEIIISGKTVNPYNYIF